MKVCTCPWCKGSGHVNSVKTPIDTRPGSVFIYEPAPCKKCEGSGVIAYKPVRDVSEYEAS